MDKIDVLAVMDDDRRVIELAHGIAPIPRVLADHDKARDAVAELIEAQRDMLAGWRYIREVYGDLYGVGWERAEAKAAAALAKVQP